MAIKHGLNLCLRDFIPIFWLDLVLDEKKTKREAIFVDTGRGHSLTSSKSVISHNLTNIYFDNNFLNFPQKPKGRGRIREYG